MVGQEHEADQGRPSARSAIGLVSDVGGALAAISMFVAVAASAVGAIAGLVNDESGIFMLGAGSFGGLAVGAGCTYGILARRGSSLEVQRGYRWLQATYTYEVFQPDPHRHRQTAEIRIKAIRHGVRTFSNQYRWSGSGKDNGPTVTSPGHTLVKPIRHELAWRLYDVRLEPALQRGQATTVELRHDLEDHDERFELYLAKTVHEAIDSLQLRVILPIALRPERVWRVTRLGAGPQAKETSRTLVQPTRSGTQCFLEWIVLRPTVGRNYQLCWAYNDDLSLYAMAREATTGDDGPPTL